MPFTLTILHGSPMKKAFLVFILLLSGSVNADFLTALNDYQKGNYVNAYNEFLSLATIGEKQSQFNIGIMYFYGQHVAKDVNKAYAWVKLANESELTTDTARNAFNAIAAKVKEMTVAEKEYQLLKQAYSTEILLNKLYPILVKPDKAHSFFAKPRKIIKAKYPRKAAMSGTQGWVKFKFDIDANGIPRNIRVLESYPKGFFERDVLKVVPKWRFGISDKDSKQVKPEQDAIYRYRFRLNGNPYGIKKDIEKEYKQRAESGDASAQFSYAQWQLKGWVRDKESNPNEWFLKSAIQGHPSSQFQVGKNLIYGKGCKKSKGKGVEWLTRSAAVGQEDSIELLAIIYSKNHDLESQQKAINYFEKIENFSSSAKLSYAWMLATSNHAQISDPERAIDLIDSVYRNRFVDDITPYEIKAAAYASMGKFEKAISAQKDALEEAEDIGASLDIIQSNLIAYQKGETYKKL